MQYVKTRLQDFPESHAYPQGGHHTFNESTQHFSNFSINDTQIFPTNTLNSWRVNDTVTFSNISILSTTLDATYHLPLTGESLDGEFGLAKRLASFPTSRTIMHLMIR